MKKVVSLVISLLLIIGIVPISASAKTTFTTQDGITYKINTTTGEAEVDDADTSIATANIKSEVDGYSVTSIGFMAFNNCTSLTSVTIPDSVTSIGDSAFSWCESLTSVTIPDSVTSIGGWAFYGCTSLTEITIPDSVTSIGRWAFAGCTSLTSITIPGSVTSIGERAFGYYYDYGYKKLENFTIYGYTGSAAETYANENGFTFIDVENMPEPPTTQDGIKYIIDTTVGEAKVVGADSGIVTADIPSKINGYPVTSIGFSAFKDCTSLTSVTIPDSVTSIGDLAFCGCTSLTSVTIPDSVISIGEYAFEGCTSLTTVTIPDSVTSIGKYAFEGCTSLTAVTIGDSVTSIGEYAFEGCTSLTTVTIPDSVTSIGFNAFYNCTSLTAVTIGDSVTSIGGLAFDNTAYYNDETNWENGVLYLGNYLIDAKNDISGKYNIKDGTKVIADEAFYNCTSLTSVIIPDSVTSIGDYAFYCCESLTSVTIPDSVTSIGDYAFGYYYDYDNWKIQKIENFTIYGYTGSAAETYANENDFTFINIENTPETPTTQDGIKYIIDTTVGEAKVVGADSGIVTADIPSEINGYPVTSIGERAFSYCTSLTSVTIPDSVTSIGDWAFRECTSLTEVTIPDSVTSIGGRAFYYCTSLTSVTIGGSVTSIGDWAFRECTSLTEVTIPDSVTSIGNYAFRGCTSLTSVTIGGSVTSIGNSAFGYYYDDNWETQKIENFTIYGYTGSAAETYANENGFTFIDIENMPETPTTQGDLNGDGKVSVADARSMLFAIAGGNADNQDTAIADFNGDGKLSIVDVRLLLVKIANGEV